jgi:hypothetical protein
MTYKHPATTVGWSLLQAADAAAARTAIGAAASIGASVSNSFAATVGNGSSTSIPVTHNLGTLDVVVSVHLIATGEEVECDIVKTSTNVVTLNFATAPTSNSLRCTIIGNAFSSSGSQTVVSVIDYNAVADGVADDTAAINAALSAVKAAGGGVVVLGRKHLVSAPLVVDEYVTLRGLGGQSINRGTMITSSALTGPVVKVIGRSARVEKMTITSTTEREAAGKRPTTAAAGTGTTATLTFAASPNVVVGDRITVSNVTPTGYNGTYTVTATSGNSVSYACAATGSQTVAGTVSICDGHGVFVYMSEVARGTGVSIGWSRVELDDLFIYRQPTDGVHTIGTCELSQFNLVTVQDCLRHGYLFSSGSASGYTNLRYPPFMVRLSRCRAFECGGQALIACEPTTGEAAQGIHLDNFEALNCCWDSAKTNAIASDANTKLFQIQLGGFGHIIDRLDCEDQFYANTTTSGGQPRTAKTVPAKGVYSLASGVTVTAPFFSSLAQSWLQGPATAGSASGIVIKYPTINPGQYGVAQNPAISFPSTAWGVEVRYLTSMTTGATKVVQSQSLNAKIEADGVPQIGLTSTVANWADGVTPVAANVTSGTLTTTSHRTQVGGEGGLADTLFVIRLASGLNGVAGLDLWLYRGSQDITIKHAPLSWAVAPGSNIFNASGADVVMTATKNNILHYVYDGTNWVQSALTEAVGKTDLAINVKDYGAVGDWNPAASSVVGGQTGTDDSDAFDRALAAVNSTGSRKLYVPAGNYRLTRTFLINIQAYGGITIEGANSANLYIDHTNGAGVRITGRSVTIRKLGIRCSDLRSGAAYDSTNIGLLVADTGTNRTFTRTRFEDLDILGHPSHGCAITGYNPFSVYERILCQDNKGHGFVIDGGECIGQVNNNNAPPGINTLRHTWAINNGGHGLVIGNPAATNMPFRILVDNMDSTGNATNPAARFTTDDMWLLGENCEIRRSAVGPPTPTIQSISSNGSTATLTFATNPYFEVGNTIQVGGVIPLGYNGTYTVTAASTSAPWTVSYASTTTGSMTSTGTGVNQQINASKYGMRISGIGWIVKNNRYINVGRSVTVSGNTIDGVAPGGSTIENLRVINSHSSIDQAVGVVIEAGVIQTKVHLSNTLNMVVPVQDNSANTAGNIITSSYELVTPATLLATNNDYNWELGKSVLRLTAASGGSTISGFAWPSSGRQMRLLNVGTNNITLLHEGTGSTSTKRIITPTGSDFILPLNQSVLLVYDGGLVAAGDTASRWRVMTSIPTTANTSRTVVTLTSSSPTTLGTGDHVVFLNGSGNAVLPTAGGSNSRYVIKNIDSANRTVATTSPQTIEGSATYTIPPGTSIEVFSDGANWRII